jgi:hypothetical protein
LREREREREREVKKKIEFIEREGGKKKFNHCSKIKLYVPNLKMHCNGCNDDNIPQTACKSKSQHTQNNK